MKGYKIYEASLKPNPQAYLMEQLNEMNSEDLDWLLAEVWPRPLQPLSPLHPQCAVLEDIDNYSDKDTGCKISKYVYFATCISHVWLTNGTRLLKEDPIVCYVKPNETVPYLWFHATDTRECLLLKHTMPDLSAPFRVTLRIPHQEKQQLAFDLRYNNSIKSCSTSESFLGLLFDPDQKIFKATDGIGERSFMIVLTCGFRYDFCGMYYNAKESKKIWYMSTLIHKK